MVSWTAVSPFGARWRSWPEVAGLSSASVLCFALGSLVYQGYAPMRVPAFALLLVVSFVAWVLGYRRQRELASVPVSRVDTAAQGYVRLSGQARCIEDWPLLVAPASLRQCLWYRWQTFSKDSDGHWVRDDEDESHRSFWLDDGSGSCFIDPDVLTILPSEAHKRTRREAGRMQHEWVIMPGEPIQAVGNLRTRHASAELDMAGDVRDLLADWKKDRKSLLERFDLDRDGELDLREWDLARGAARREVERSHNQVREQAAYTHYLEAAQGRPSLASAVALDKLGRNYRWQAWFHLATFFASLLILIWALRPS